MLKSILLFLKQFFLDAIKDICAAIDGMTNLEIVMTIGLLTWAILFLPSMLALVGCISLIGSFARAMYPNPTASWWSRRPSHPWREPGCP